MANRVLHQWLQQHRRHLRAPHIRRHVPLDVQSVSETRLLDPDIRLYELQLFAQRNLLASLDGEKRAEQLAESAYDLERLLIPFGEDERTYRVQGIEQKVWPQLQRQRAQLCRGEVGAKAFGSQLLFAANIRACAGSARRRG